RAVERRNRTIPQHLELMHPKYWRRRRRTLPPNPWRIQQVHIPDVGRHLQRSAEQGQLETLLVPKVRDAWIPGRRRRRPDVGLVRLALRYPDCIASQLRARLFLEQVFLDFGGPPKTTASTRRHEHDDADLIDVGVERLAQLLIVIANGLVRDRGRVLAVAG